MGQLSGDGFDIDAVDLDFGFVVAAKQIEKCPRVVRQIVHLGGSRGQLRCQRVEYGVANRDLQFFPRGRGLLGGFVKVSQPFVRDFVDRPACCSQLPFVVTQRVRLAQQCLHDAD